MNFRYFERWFPGRETDVREVEKTFENAYFFIRNAGICNC